MKGRGPIKNVVAEGIPDQVPGGALRKTIARAHLILEDGLALIAGTFVVVMMAVTVADISLRSLFNAPLQGAYEMTEFMMGGVVFLGLAYVQRAKGHLAIEILTHRLPLPGQRIVRVLGYLIALMLFCAIAWESSKLAYRAWDIQDYTMGAARLPLWPARSAIALGSFMFCIRLVIDMVSELVALAGRQTTK